MTRTQSARITMPAVEVTEMKRAEVCGALSLPGLFPSGHPQVCGSSVTGGSMSSSAEGVESTYSTQHKIRCMVNCTG